MILDAENVSIHQGELRQEVWAQLALLHWRRFFVRCDHSSKALLVHDVWRVSGGRCLEVLRLPTEEAAVPASCYCRRVAKPLRAARFSDWGINACIVYRRYSVGMRRGPVTCCPACQWQRPPNPSPQPPDLGRSQCPKQAQPLIAAGVRRMCRCVLQGTRVAVNACTAWPDTHHSTLVSMRASRACASSSRLPRTVSHSNEGEPSGCCRLEHSICSEY